MFICYLDDSDHSGGSVITLAGYVAKVASWEAYEAHASKIYAERAIGDVLHAIEFHASRTPFRGWSIAKKMSLVGDLFGRRQFLHGISVSVDKVNFRAAAATGHKGIGPNMSPLGFAFAVLLHKLVRGTPMSSFIQTDGLSFVIEDGHKNNAGISAYFDRVKDHEIFLGSLGALSFAGKADAKALHLADMLAFYSRRHHTRLMRHGANLIIPPEKYLDRMRKKVPIIEQTIALDNPETLRFVEDHSAGDAEFVRLPIDYRAG